MIIMKEHALLLLKFGQKWKDGAGLFRIQDNLTEEELEALHQLHLQDIIYEEEGEFILTSSGDKILNALELAMEEKLLPHPEEWDKSFRWIGSEVISMIDVALTSQGFVEDRIKQALTERGFVSGENLNEAAYLVWDAYEEAEPRLIIPKALADYIKQLPPGPAYKKFLPPSGSELFELESMRLIAFSIPVSDIYALTGLGQQVRAALLKGAPAFQVLIDEEILQAIYEFAVNSEALSPFIRDRLLALAYITEDGNLTEAGRHLLTAARVYFEGPIIVNPSIHLDLEDVEVLKTIKELEENGNSTLKEIEKKVKKEFPDLDVLQSIMFLESFRLLNKEECENGICYTLSRYGERILEDSNKARSKVPAFGVKAITMSRMEYFAPQPDWVEYAEKAQLLGNGFPSKAGRLYAQIASRVMRLPFINDEMREILGIIPYERGITFERIMERAGKKFDESKVKEILMKLDAQAIIDAMPENIYVLTEIGKLIKRAIQVVPPGTKYVLTPGICTILLALAEAAGTEERRRIKLPENLKEAEKISGLPPSVFEEEFMRAKRNRFIGSNSVFESGMLVIDACKELANIRDIWEEIAV